MKNKEEMKEYKKLWARGFRLNHENDKEYKQYVKSINDSYYKIHREELREKARIRMNNMYRDNPSLIIERNKKWSKNNPEKVLSLRTRILQKVSSDLQMNCVEYESARRAWSHSIRKKDNNKCQICGGIGEISHHILYKSFYPKLSLNINNGTTLCKEHHKEVHLFDKFGVS